MWRLKEMPYLVIMTERQLLPRTCFHNVLKGQTYLKIWGIPSKIRKKKKKSSPIKDNSYIKTYLTALISLPHQSSTITIQTCLGPNKSLKNLKRTALNHLSSYKYTCLFFSFLVQPRLCQGVSLAGVSLINSALFASQLFLWSRKIHLVGTIKQYLVSLKLVFHY